MSQIEILDILKIKINSCFNIELFHENEFFMNASSNSFAGCLHNVDGGTRLNCHSYIGENAVCQDHQWSSFLSQS